MAIKNATPTFITPGYEDRSGRAPVSEPDTTPFHFPLIFIQAAGGPLDVIAPGSKLTATYGDKSFDARSPFYSHATHLLSRIQGAGSTCMVKRLVSADAASAKLVVGLEVVEEDVTDILRNADGTPQLDGNGDIQLDSTTTAGYRLAWRLMNVNSDETLETVKPVTPGTLAGKAGAVSTIYPVMALETFIGSMYNGYGLRLGFPTGEEFNRKLADDNGAYFFEAKVVTTTSTGSTKVARNKDNTNSVLFSFKPGAYDHDTQLDLNPERIVTSYETREPFDGQPDTYGPFDKIHVYQQNIDTIAALLKASEEAATGETFTGYDLNIFTAVSPEDVPYYSFIVDSSSEKMNGFSTLQATGGADGQVGPDALATLVTDFMESGWEDPAFALKDLARYPFSDLYDSGFPMSTKLALIRGLSYRPDIGVTLSPQDVSQPQNDLATEQANGLQLNAALGLYPESEVNGTAVVRGAIFGHSGYDTNSPYNGLVAAGVVDIAVKRSAFTGGVSINEAGAYDRDPANQIVGFSGLNNTYMPRPSKEKNWLSNINYVESANRESGFWPAYQSVCRDDTSILNSEITMRIMNNITRVCHEVWRKMTGTSDLTEAQFAEEAVRKFNAITEFGARYGNRVVVQPRCYFTFADEARGYSWSFDVEVYAGNQKTVGTFNVIARRISDLD